MVGECPGGSGSVQAASPAETGFLQTGPAPPSPAAGGRARITGVEPGGNQARRSEEWGGGGLGEKGGRSLCRSQVTRLSKGA